MTVHQFAARHGITVKDLFDLGLTVAANIDENHAGEILALVRRKSTLSMDRAEVVLKSASFGDTDRTDEAIEVLRQIGVSPAWVLQLHKNGLSMAEIVEGVTKGVQRAQRDAMTENPPNVNIKLDDGSTFFMTGRELVRKIQDAAGQVKYDLMIRRKEAEADELHEAARAYRESGIVEGARW